MGQYDFVSLKRANDGKKKYAVTLKNKTTGREKTVKFGAAGMSDFTKNHDEERKKSYIARHAKTENWTASGVDTAGFWSKHLLWSGSSVTSSLAAIKSKYF